MDMLSLALIVLSLHPLSLPHLHLAFPLPTMLSLFQIAVFVTLATTVLAPAQIPYHIILPSHQRNLPLPARESAPCVCDNNEHTIVTVDCAVLLVEIFPQRNPGQAKRGRLPSSLLLTCEGYSFNLTA